MQHEDIQRQLADLAQRLQRIELLLHLTHQPASGAPTTSANISSDGGVGRRQPQVASVVETSAADVGSQAGRIDASDIVSDKCVTFKRLQVDWRKSGGERPLQPPEQAALASAAPAAAVAKPVPSTRIVSSDHARAAAALNVNSLEVLIGGKWMAWLGALTVLVSVAFAIMVGVKHGWWGQLSPQMRCLGIAGFGALLLIGGEIALRRLGPAAAVGLLSAGLGTLYMDAFATFRFFHLLSSEGAFILMALAAVVGIALTLRTGFLTIGVLSLLGGYLTPLLLRGQQSHDVELLAYLTMLLAIALGLSGLRPRSFRALRYLGLGAQIIVGGLWILANARSAEAGWLLGIFFAAIWWAMVLAESLYAAIRRQSVIGNIIAVFIATAAFVVAGCWILRLGPAAPSAIAAPQALQALVVANWLGVFTLLTAVSSAIIALQFGSSPVELRQPRNPLDKLALALWAQTGVLLAVAIALQFRGLAESVGWMALAIAAIETGRRMFARGVTIFGLIVGGLAIVRITMLDWWVTSGMQTPLWQLGDVMINRWSLLALSAILITHVAAHRVWWPPADRAHPLPIGMAALATLGWLALAVIQTRGITTTGAWLLAPVVLLALRRRGRRQAYLQIAGVVIGLTAARWLSIDALLARLNPSWNADALLPLLNTQVCMAALIVGVTVWFGRIAAARCVGDDTSVTRSRIATDWQWMLIAIGVFSLLVLGFEIDRGLAALDQPASWLSMWEPLQQRGLLFTALWSAGALALVRIGVQQRMRLVRSAGFIIIMLAALIWLTFDTLSWRISIGPATGPALLNLQSAVAVIVISSLAIARAWMRGIDDPSSTASSDAVYASRAGMILIALIGLVAGSLEIDRFLLHEPMARQASLSAFWGAYGVMLVIVGFLRQVPAARYSGLALLALVALKVVLIDFAYLDDLPRVISTLVAGLLFIGTSMLYFKLMPRLTQNARAGS